MPRMTWGTDLLRARIDGVHVHVASQADVIDADELGHVVEVIEEIVEARGAAAADEGGDGGDPHHPSLGRHGADRLVGLAARVGHQGPAVRVGDQHGFFEPRRRRAWSRSEQWETSTAMPALFMAVTISAPKGVKPPPRASRQPAPIRFFSL